MSTKPDSSTDPKTTLSGTFRERHAAVLQSPRWRQLRITKYKSQGGRCGGCSKPLSLKLLQLHHKHYDNLGNETEEDVTLVCEICHLIADRKRIINKSIHTFCERYYENTGKDCPEDVLQNWIDTELIPGLPSPESRGISRQSFHNTQNFLQGLPTYIHPQQPKQRPPLRYITPGRSND